MEPRKRRSAMKPTSEAARRWAESLRLEVEQWPAVTVKKAFGMVMVYRREVVFAALPATRALFEEDAILIKFARETPALVKKIAAEKRFAAGTMEQQGNETRREEQRGKKKPGEGRKWRIYLLREERDARESVEWLARAYKLAGN